MDPVVKAEVGSQTKSADAELARIQTLVLDAVGPSHCFGGPYGS